MIEELVESFAIGNRATLFLLRKISDEALAASLSTHDAHHRGHALLTLRQAKVMRPDTLRFGVWDWNRL